MRVFLMKNEKFLTKLFRAARDVITSPAVLLVAADAILASQTAEIGAILLNAGVTVVATALCAYESWTGKKKGLPWYATALVGGLTSLSVLYNGIFNQGIAPFSLTDEAKKMYFSAAAFAFWCSGDIRRGLHEARGSHAKGALDDEQFYFGLGDAFAVGRLSSSAFFLLGVAKTYFKRQQPEKEPLSVSAFLSKHITPARLIALGYLSGALQTGFSDPILTTAQILWTSAYLGMDEGENHALRQDVKRLVVKTDRCGLE